MTHSTAMTWMVFDLGGVVLSDTAALPDLAEHMRVPDGVTPDKFRAAYSAPRFDYDRDSDAVTYWRAVADGCGAPAPTAKGIAELTAMDVAGWSVTDPATLQLIDDLNTAGIRLAVLSNAPSAMGDHVRRQPWADVFEHIIISGEIGLVKPDAAIYDALLDTLGAHAASVAFTDDRADNIAAAADAGIRAIRFTGAATLRRELGELGVMPPGAS